jgi:peptidoglycan hydrolase-like protein with peptidoglycan-binding domain
MRKLAIAGFGALLFGILVNAVVLQKGRHPAPLFASRPSPARRTVSPRAAQAPARLSARPAVALNRQAPPPPAAAPATQAPRASGDALGALIEKEAVDVGSAERLYSVQHALRRLGYQVKPSGRMDAPTRAALARFERASGLPVTESATARVIRALATRSGVHIR